MMGVQSLTLGVTLFIQGAGGCFSYATASAVGKVIKVPFEFDREAIIVQAKINGKGPFNMMLDTGADPSVIDLGTAKELGLKMDTTGQEGSGTGTDVNLAYQTSVPRLELGGLTARNVGAVAMNLSKITAAVGKPVQGVLGYSVLKDRIVQFDYPGRVVRFFSSTPTPNAAQGSNPAKFTVLSFQYRDDLLVDGVSVDGKRVVANLDTGSNSGFQITAAAAIDCGETAGSGQVEKSAGFNGEAANHLGKVKNITLGGISLDTPPVVFLAKGAGYDHEAWGIRIGNGFLKDFVVTVDYRNHDIILVRP